MVRRQQHRICVPLIRYNTARLVTTDMQHRSIQHDHHVASRSMTRDSLFATNSSNINNPATIEPTGSSAYGPMEMFAAHSSYKPSAAALQGCIQPVDDDGRHPKANRINSKGNPGASEELQGQPFNSVCSPTVFLIFLAR